MKVTLLNSTPNAEEHIVEVARVSSSRKDKKGKPEGLLNYLIKHKHWSPFEMVSMCIKINTTRSIAAQILRHRSFSFQEYSQRYAEVTERPSALMPRRQDTKNRQNSIDDLDEFTVQDFQVKAKLLYDHAYTLYHEMLDCGVAKESAREG